VFYPYSISCQHGARWRGAAGIALAGITFLALPPVRSLPLSRGVGMVLVSRTLVPVIGLVQVGEDSLRRIGTLTCQTVGLAIMLSWGTADLLSVTRAPGPWSSSRRWWPVLGCVVPYPLDPTTILGQHRSRCPARSERERTDTISRI